MVHAKNVPSRAKNVRCPKDIYLMAEEALGLRDTTSRCLTRPAHKNMHGADIFVAARVAIFGAPQYVLQSIEHQNVDSVAFCSPAKSLTFSGFMENQLVGKKLKS